MDLALKKLEQIEGVLGGFIHHAGKGIVAANPPEIFTKSQLQRQGELLMELFTEGNEHFHEHPEISVYYDGITVLLRKISRNNVLIVYCEPSADQKSITTSLKQFVELLEKRIRKAKKEERDRLIGFLLEKSEIAYPLSGMRNALIHVLGPFGQILFKEAINEWIDTNQPSEETLPKFIDILCKVIKDPEKVRHFIKLIVGIVEPKQ